MHQQWRHSIFFVFVASVWITNTSGNERQSVKSLIPNVLLANEEIIPEVEVRRFRLTNLQPNSQYEVRISYPAYIPTEFFISFTTPKKPIQYTRSLLNIEKMTFQTDNNGDIIGQSRLDGFYEIEVTAERRGVSPQRNHDQRPVPFTIILETMYFGVPWGVYRLTALFLGVTFCVLLLSLRLKSKLL
jgi:hypothetical protein